MVGGGQHRHLLQGGADWWYFHIYVSRPSPRCIGGHAWGQVEGTGLGYQVWKLWGDKQEMTINTWVAIFSLLLNPTWNLYHSPTMTGNPTWLVTAAPPPSWSCRVLAPRYTPAPQWSPGLPSSQTHQHQKRSCWEDLHWSRCFLKTTLPNCHQCFCQWNWVGWALEWQICIIFT